MNKLALSIGLGLALMASPGWADPCEAVQMVGRVPAHLSPGKVFSGPVTLVIDGDSFCVEVAPGRRNWVEVRLADFFAPEGKAPGGAVATAALQRLALGRTAVCTAGRRTHDRIAARCAVNGRDLGEALRQAGIAEGGNGRRMAPAVRPRPAARNVAGPQPFPTCAAARAAGKSPVRRGQPGYNPLLDGDGDGIACEPIRPK